MRSALPPLLALAGLLGVLDTARADAPPRLKIRQTDEAVEIETDMLRARIRAKGYVSGVEAGTFTDKKTGAREAGFGLHIMDFLMAPGWKTDGYSRDPRVHGNLPKHYVEGPQICTQARELHPEVMQGADFAAVRLHYRFTQPAPGLKAGSTWEQTLVFQPGLRYFFSSEAITSVNTVEDLFYRVDMPGHIRHRGADTFSQVYLSYAGKIPASAFAADFGPNQRFLYQREAGKVPQRMIRAYQVTVQGRPGPWLAGMTLDPGEVCEAWCHERGYVCFIEELHGKKVQAGETLGAAYIVGYFDDIADMEKGYDRYKGKRRIIVEKGKFCLE
jgi:hypothetical protein